jgi:dTDP-4-amino-4,6-dideoxygalactose transaminase
MTRARVPITRPSLGAEEQAAAARVIGSGWITQGPEVAALEQDLACVLGAKHAVCVSNATSAIELCLRALGVRPGDDVITVSHSFIATANAVVAVGARPVFVDIERDTLGMSPKRLEESLTPKTRAVLCVHQIGIPCDIEGILDVANRAGLPVVEDAACAIGSEIKIGEEWQRIGRPHGVLACFSFHPRKVVTTGDGGAITTNDESLAKRFRLLRQHAMSVSDTIRHASDKVVFEDYLEPAYNYRMTDLQASVGRPQIARLDRIIEERRSLARLYGERLAHQRVFEVPRERANARWNFQTYALRIRRDSGVTQLEAMQYLLDHGVACKRGVQNAHQEIAYQDASRWAQGPGGLAESIAARDEMIQVPLFNGITEEEREHVLKTLLDLAARK